MSWKMTKMMKHNMTNHETFANGRRSGDNKKLHNAAFAIERHRAQRLYDATCKHIPLASRMQRFSPFVKIKKDMYRIIFILLTHRLILCTTIRDEEECNTREYYLVNADYT